MTDEILEIIVKKDIEGDFTSWFLDFFKDDSANNCSVEEFAVFFLNFIRNQTERLVKKNTSSSCDTPNELSVTLPLNASSNPATKNLLSVSAKEFKSESRRLNKSEHVPGSFSNASPFQNLRKSLPPEQLPWSPEYKKTNFTSTSTPKEKNRNIFPNPSPIGKVNTEPGGNRRTTSIRNVTRSSSESPKPSDKSKSFEKGKSFGRTTISLSDFLVSSPLPKQNRRSLSDAQSVSSNRSTVEILKNPSTTSTNIKHKPKRRVVPTPVASTSNAFSSPVLRKENNILKIAENEIHDRSSCIEERQVLRNELNSIVEEFQKETLQQPSLHLTLREKLLPSKPSSCFSKTTDSIPVVDLPVVTSKRVLDRLIEIHSALIDLNLTTNILGELSYLVNLLNAEDDLAAEQSLTTTESRGQDNRAQIDPSLINRSNNELYTVLKKLSNCVYFALGALTKQKHLLALLDTTTLRVVLNNERLENLNGNLQKFLWDIYTHKTQLESLNPCHDISFRIGHSFTNVTYQQDNDTKNNFPSCKEFVAFNKQRDMFCTILRIWEDKHLDHTWDFSQELRPKIRELFEYMDHPINMAHLAKLFTSQLIVSSNFSESPVGSEIASLNVDPNKLSKLHQRLVTPSQFSTDYLFPGNQIFFKDFLLVTNSIHFLEQLKIALIAELMEINNSSFEIIKLVSNTGNVFSEYVVRPEIMSTMRVLAKFLGFVMSHPFTYEENKNAMVDNRQIELRNMLQPSFDIMAILRKSVVDRKLIITLPWVIQYLVMLDHITLKLTYYVRLTEFLFELYINLKDVQNSSESLKMRPTSIFILQLNLCWLFDYLNLSERYYSYRKNRRDILQKDVLNEHSEMIKSLDKMLNVSSTKEITKTELTFKKVSNDSKSMMKGGNLPTKVLSVQLQHSFDPLLEGILSAACPFLADFRVSIMPQKFSKCLSRTGKYRHITTKMSSEITPGTDRDSDIQEKLSEAFLHSQSLSMRRIVEFVIERVTSAVIKDFQMEVLIPSKTEAMNKVSQICSMKLDNVIKEMQDIFNNANESAMQVWKCKVPEWIENRVKKCLDGLLPNETMEIVRKTCTALIVQKCKIKTENWGNTNLVGLDFYSKNIPVDAAKHLKSYASSSKLCSTALEIDISKGCYPSEIFDRLQCWLHYTSTDHNQITMTSKELEIFCVDFLNCLQSQNLPTLVYRMSGLMIIGLVQNLIRSYEEVLTKTLVGKFLDILLCEKLKDFVKITERTCDHSVDTENSSSEGSETCSNQIAEESTIFDSLITKCFIQSLGDKESSFDCLREVLISMVSVNLLTVGYLNEQFVALFKEDWPPNVLQHISNVLNSICKCPTSCNTSDNEKSQLFMEMLAEFTRDFDEYL